MFKKMNKKMIASIVLLSLILILTLSFLAVRASGSREVTLTTYYPAPYGNYNTLTVKNNFGIGTTSPEAKLDVNGVTLARSTLIMKSGSQIQMNNAADVAQGFLQGVNVGTNNTIQFQNTGGFPTMTVDTTGSGKVGIGTTSPYDNIKLQINTKRTDDHYQLGLINDGGGDASVFMMAQDAGPQWSKWRLRANKANMRFDILGMDNPNPFLSINYNGNVGIGTTIPYRIFQVRPSANNNFWIGSYSEAGQGVMIGSCTDDFGLNRGLDIRGNPIILAGGNVGIGMTDAASFTLPGATLTVLGHSNVGDSWALYVKNPSALPMLTVRNDGHVGIGTADPEGYTLKVIGTTYSSSGYQGSDIRFKKNISAINKALEKVLKLRGVIFEWKTKEYKKRGFSEGKHYGVIAQEIEKILPEIVSTDSKGEKAVSYTEIIPVLIEAIKEQQKQIEGLKEQQKAQQKQITELKAQNKLLEQRLAALEKAVKVKRK